MQQHPSVQFQVVGCGLYCASSMQEECRWDEQQMTGLPARGHWGRQWVNIVLHMQPPHWSDENMGSDDGTTNVADFYSLVVPQIQCMEELFLGQPQVNILYLPATRYDKTYLCNIM